MVRPPTSTLFNVDHEIGENGRIIFFCIKLRLFSNNALKTTSIDETIMPKNLVLVSMLQKNIISPIIEPHSHDSRNVNQMALSGEKYVITVVEISIKGEPKRPAASEFATATKVFPHSKFISPPARTALKKLTISKNK